MLFGWLSNCSQFNGCRRRPGRFLRRRFEDLESMSFIVAAVLGGFGILLAAIAGLRAQRRTLRESVEQFRLRADQAPVLIWTARPDTSLDYLNGFCEQLTGRPLEELRENGWLAFVHPEDVDRCLATYMPAFEARRPFLLEYRLRHADGDYRWFLASGVPMHGRDGSFTGYLGCDTDITARKTAEDRIRESQAALEVSHQELRYLAGRLIEAQEIERTRIARDLHDDVSQQVAGISIVFSSNRSSRGRRPGPSPCTWAKRSANDRAASQIELHGARYPEHRLKIGRPIGVDPRPA